MKTAPLLALALLALATSAHAQFGSLVPPRTTPLPPTATGPLIGPDSVYLGITDADVDESLLPALTAAMQAGPGRAKALDALKADAAKRRRYCVVTRTLSAEFMAGIKSTFPVATFIPFDEDGPRSPAQTAPLGQYSLTQTVSATLHPGLNGFYDVTFYLEEHSTSPSAVATGPLHAWSGQTNEGAISFSPDADHLPTSGTRLISAVSTGGGVTHAVYITVTVPPMAKSDAPITLRGF